MPNDGILSPDWIVNLRDISNSVSEFGSSSPIDFWEPTLTDSQGQEIETPICPKCNVGMTQLIGREAFQWVCSQCIGNEDDKSDY